MAMIIAIAPTVEATSALEEATTWTAAMKVIDGPNMKMPTTNAVSGFGSADQRAITPGFFCLPASSPGFFGFGLWRYMSTAAMSATTPRPRRSPYLVWWWLGKL